MADDAVVRATWERILTDPAAWRQMYFAQKTDCGTAFCFAGHAALVTGCNVNVVEYPADDYRPAWTDFVWTDPNGNEVFVDDWSQEVLGFNEEQADEIFYRAYKVEDLDQMREIVEEVTGVTLYN